MDNSSKSDAKSSSVSRPSQVVKDSVLHRRSKIPEAYRVKEFRGRLYIVPKFLDLSTESAVAAIEERDKLQMKVDDVSRFNTAAFITDLTVIRCSARSLPESIQC